MAISTVPDPSGSGRVDMLTSPVAAARAAAATGACVKSKHDNMYLIRGSVGAWALFLPIRRRINEAERHLDVLFRGVDVMLRSTSIPGTKYAAWRGESPFVCSADAYYISVPTARERCSTESILLRGARMCSKGA